MSNSYVPGVTFPMPGSFPRQRQSPLSSTSAPYVTDARTSSLQNSAFPRVCSHILATARLSTGPPTTAATSSPSATRSSGCS